MEEKQKTDLHLIEHNVMCKVQKKQVFMEPSHATFKFMSAFIIHDISQTISALNSFFVYSFPRQHFHL